MRKLGKGKGKQHKNQKKYYAIHEIIRYISIAKTKFIAIRLGIALNLPFLYWKK